MTTQSETGAPCRLCDGQGCEDCSQGREYCEECPGHLLQLATGWYDPNTGEESEPFDVRFIVDAGNGFVPTRWVPEDRKAALAASCLRVQLRVISMERRESSARALCESHRECLTQIPTAEDWRDVRADLAWDGAR